MNLELFLSLLSGILWTIVYIDSIRIGLKDKTYAMPLWALGLNITWEFLHAVLGFQEQGLTAQIVINGIWFLFDIGLLYTYFRFGQPYFPKHLPANWFYGWGILALVVSGILQYLFIFEFGRFMGAVYSAFLQNLLMSILYIAMLVQRGNREGQTLVIAVCKWLGTVAPTILFGVLSGGALTAPSIFVLVVGVMISIFDILYILMLLRTPKTKS